LLVEPNQFGDPPIEYKKHAEAYAEKVLECGDIYFLYRPAVGVDETHGFKDVRRLYILLKPWGTRIYRLIIIGRKKLPAPEEHDRFWAFVWRVFKDRVALSEELGYEEYETKTRGVRKIPRHGLPRRAFTRSCGMASIRIWRISWKCPSARVRSSAS
jgi:hypothetical protein